MTAPAVHTWLQYRNGRRVRGVSALPIREIRRLAASGPTLEPATDPALINVALAAVDVPWYTTDSRTWEPACIVCLWKLEAVDQFVGRCDRCERFRPMTPHVPRPENVDVRPTWRGLRVSTIGGYPSVHLPDHPNAASNGYIGIHRLIMSEKLGRPLDRVEYVKHRDGNRWNWTIGNLELARAGFH
jgi:hypothetical protein